MAMDQRHADTTSTWEPIDLTQADVCDDLALLMNACEAREPLILRTLAAEDLPGLLTDPGAFHEEGQLWRGAAGGAEAFGFLRFFHVNGIINADVRFFVTPPRWQRGYAHAILTWAVARAQAVQAAYGTRLWLYSDSLPTGVWRRAALERHGFAPVRSSCMMEHALTAPGASVPLPEGYDLATVSGPADLPAWVALFNLAYCGQWNYVPTTIDVQAALRQDVRYQQHYDLVVRAVDGQLVAFCLGFVLERGGTTAGWVLELGTHPAFRGRGLARSLLSEALHRFYRDGLLSARLVVDSANPTAAQRLYEHLGFAAISSEILYGRLFAADDGGRTPDG